VNEHSPEPCGGGEGGKKGRKKVAQKEKTPNGGGQKESIIGNFEQERRFPSQKNTAFSFLLLSAGGEKGRGKRGSCWSRSTLIATRLSST